MGKLRLREGEEVVSDLSYSLNPALGLHSCIIAPVCLIQKLQAYSFVVC